MKKLVCGFVLSAAVALGAVVFAAAAEPVVSFDGDTITVTVPDGTVTTNASLYLCWGALDAGEKVSDWSHSVCLSDGGVTATGGVWTASAAEHGIVEGNPMRAVVFGPLLYKEVEYVETPSTVTPGKGGNDSAPNNKTLGVYTGIDAKTGLHVKTRMRWLAYADSELCGGRYTNGTGDHTRIFTVHTYDNCWCLGYGGSSVYTEPCSLNTDYEVETKLYLGSQTLFVDGVQVYEFNNNYEVDTGSECLVFGAYYTESASLDHLRLQAHARCYYLKMWEDGNTTDNPDGDLVRDFVPVKSSDGYGALYDKVSGTVFDSVSNGTETPQYLVVGDETGATYYSEPRVAACSRLKHYLRDDIKATIIEGQVNVTVQSQVVISETNELVVCWGDHDYGDQAADWPHVLSAHYAVGQEGGSFVFPASEIEPGSAVRAFLVESIGLVDYISSVDNAANNSVSVYLDTGVKAKHGLRVQTRIEWQVIWGDFGFMGARLDSNNTRFLPIHGYQNGQWGMGYGTGHWNNGAFAVNTPYEVESKMYTGEQRLTVDGVVKYSGTDTLAPDYNINIFAFADNWYSPSPGTPNYGCRAKCYYLKMYTGGDKTTNPDGTLARDYVPVVRGGVAGLYDRLNDTFTASAGSGVFRYGAVTNTFGSTDITYCASGLATEGDPGEDVPPSGFAFALTPSLSGNVFSLAGNFSYESTGSHSINSFVATLAVGETVVTGTVDWVGGTIAFPSVSAASDGDAVFTLAYGEGADERFVGVLPIRVGSSAWFSSTAAEMNASGVWLGATAQGGKISVTDGSAYVPNSSAVADLRVIELAGVFGTVSGAEATAPASAKFGIEIRAAEGGTNRFAVVAGGAWQVVPSVVADPAAAYRIRVELDASAGTVAYYVVGADGLMVLLGRYENPASAEVVNRIVFGGAALLDSLEGWRSGLAADYAFHATADGRRLTVTVDGDAVTNANTKLYICSAPSDRGPDIENWANKLFVAGPIHSTGGVYVVSLAAAGIKDSVVRPFLANKLDVELLTSLTATMTTSAKPRVFTGVLAKSGARVVTRMSWNNIMPGGSSDQAYFGAKQASGNSTRLMPVHCNPSQWGLGYGIGHWSLGIITNGVVCNVEAKCYAGYQELKVDGATLYTGSESTTYDLSPTDFAVFACNYKEPDATSLNFGGTGLHGCATCYSLKVYVNGDQSTNPDGDLVRDFLPARYGGVLGLWDQENNHFHPGEGGGFSGGSVVSVVETDNYRQFAAAAALHQMSGGLIIYLY